MLRVVFGIAMALVAASAASAGVVKPREGWVVIDTRHSFTGLVARLEAAVKAEKMGLVTFASASDGAKAAGFAIPGNRVVGVFRNDFARRMLNTSISAGIEAPIRFYLAENSDGTATLAYKKPTFVFMPYFDEGGEALRSLAGELDAIFAKIAEASAREP